MNHIAVLVAVLGLLVIAPLLSSAEGEAEIQARLVALETKIASLETPRPLGPGTGAYAHGSSLRIDGAGETVLERLRRLEQELAGANATIAGRERELAAAQEQAKQLAAEGGDAAQRAAGLEHVRTSLVTAQQVLSERQTRIDTLQAQLAASELARLKAERGYLQLAASVLRLQAQPAAVNDLLDLVRAEARGLAQEVKR